MTEPCFLSPPTGAGRSVLEAHLEMLRSMNRDDPLVRLAIEDTEALLAEMPDG
ncbi:MAG: hypothetical protein O3C34_12115 [Proteobacteria bacterium]|nr:hypothetical protein [Pseudomonadota bacterium]